MDTEKSLEEVRTTMKGMTTEELVRWIHHVEDNPYRVGDISRKVIEVLGVEVMMRTKGEKKHGHKTRV